MHVYNIITFYFVETHNIMIKLYSTYIQYVGINNIIQVLYSEHKPF